jgi:phenylalanyl-tRNA synthetase alpha chain
MWFIVESGTDAVSKFENFEAVNIPVSHPATEMHDTIYLSEKDERGENYVLRTHTSAWQNYVLRKYWVPIKAVLPWRVYRFENVDATHDTMFYQFEWVYVDKNVSIWHFKSIINRFLSAALQKDVEIRMRPWYFPFVEPWFEIDTRYEYTNPKNGQKEMSDWMELLWAWMIHPEVLRNAWINPDEGWTWFAFWMWVSRLAAVRYWIKDIRYLTNGDLRFSKSW